MVIKVVKKIIKVFLLVLCLGVITGGAIHLTKDESSMIQAKKKDSSKSKKEDKKVKRSYASYLFDEGDKNQSMMYFNSETGTGVDTVERVIDNKKGNGEAYASFLKTQYQWNLYNTYTNQMDAGAGIIDRILKVIFGGFLLLCLYLMDALDGIIKGIAYLFDYLNIFKYLVDGQGDIPQDNPLHVLQPLADLYKEFTGLTKLLLAIALGYILFRVGTGFGRYKARGSAFSRGFSRVAIGWISIALLPLAVSAFFGMFSDLILSQDSFLKNSVNDKPANSIVDTRAYIDNSLSRQKGKKNNDAVDGGYVLMHEGFPEKEDQVKNKVPTPKFVNYLNTGNKDGKDKPDGKSLLLNWISSNTFTEKDINSIYNVQKDDKSHWFSLWQNDEKRDYQLKLAYNADGVKLFSGKDPISMDLNATSIQTASLAGNGAIGVALNGIKMFVEIAGTTLVSLILVLSMFKALGKSTGLFISNVSISALGSPVAVFGVLSTAIMLLVSWLSVMAILPLYSNLTDAIGSNISDAVNENFNIGGMGKQVVITATVVFIQWFAAILVLRGRTALINGVEDFFRNIIERMSMYTGGQAHKGVKALNDMKNADQGGHHQRALDAMTRPLERSKEAAAAGVGAIGGIGASKLSDANQSIKDKGKEGLKNAKDRVANLRSSAKTEEDVKDSDEQGQDMEEATDKGMEKMNTNSTSGLNKNLDDQDKAVDNAIKDNEELNNAGQALDDAKNHYDQLKENGASKAELAEAQEAIGQAQNRYDRALANSQDSAKNMANTGATAESISDSKKSTANDFNKASKDAVNAENDLKSLKAERQKMVDNGATDDDLVDIDNEINEASDRLSNAQDRQELAKAANQATVGNAQQEKDLRNDVVAARQSERQAKNKLASAKTNGNLTQSQQQSFRQTANAMSGNIETLKNNANSELHQAEVEKGALEFMDNNDGKAFTPQDVSSFRDFADSTTGSVKSAQNALAQAKKRGASKSEVSTLSQNVMDANKMKAGAQTVMNAIASGRADSSSITAQEQIVENVMQQKQAAEQQMANINQATANGEIVSRDKYNSVRSNLDAATQNMNVATKTLTGLHAMKAAGTNQLLKDDVTQAKNNASQRITQAKTKAQTLNRASGIINNVNAGGNINRENVAHLVDAQEIAQQEASTKTQNAQATFDKASNRLSDLKTQLANGKPVNSEVKRMQNNVEQAGKRLSEAQNQESAIKTSNRTFKRTGRTIQQNIKNAKQEVQDKTIAKDQRDDRYNDLLRSGGYTSDQLHDLQKNINQDKKNLKANSTGFKRERRQKLNDIDDKFNKSSLLINQ